MLKDDSRTIHFFDLIVTASARNLKGLTPYNAARLVSFIKNGYDNNRAFKRSPDKRSITYLADLEISRDYAIFLINKSDRGAADPTFSDPDKNSRRTIPKIDGEGTDMSAHMIWNLNAAQNVPDTYLVFLESVPGLSSTTVRTFLTHVLNEERKKDRPSFQVQHPDGSNESNGNPRLVTIRHSLQLRGHLSDSFKEDLNQGRLLDIELYSKRNAGNAWDQSGLTNEKKTSVLLKTSPNSAGIANLPLIRDVFDSASHKDYELARVHFKTPDEQDRTIHLYTDDITIAQDQMYVKKVLLRDFQSRLAASYEKINAELVDKMLSEM